MQTFLHGYLHAKNLRYHSIPTRDTDGQWFCNLIGCYLVKFYKNHMNPFYNGRGGGSKTGQINRGNIIPSNNAWGMDSGDFFKDSWPFPFTSVWFANQPLWAQVFKGWRAHPAKVIMENTCTSDYAPLHPVSEPYWKLLSYGQGNKARQYKNKWNGLTFGKC